MADDIVGRLRANLPPQLLKAKRWLVWRGPGKDRVPYYVSGSRRFGTLDSAADVARLATFAAAVKAFRTGCFDGFGFALGPDGDANWQGIDLDNMRQDEKLAPEAESIIAIADTYTEVSPSGEGVHLIGRGKPLSTLTNDGTGVERYAAQRYFTMTGLSLNGKKLADLSVASATVIEVRRRRGSRPRAKTTGGAGPTPQGRNVALTSRAGHLRNAGLSGANLLDALHRLNAKNVPPLSGAEVAKIARSADRSFKENVAPELYTSTRGAGSGGTAYPASAVPPPPLLTPAPIAPAAFVGPLGDLVALWAGHTEASRQNILAQTIAVLSAVPDYARVYTGDAKPCGPALFLLVLGSTASRKGTGGTIALDFLARAFPAFVHGVNPRPEEALLVPMPSRVLTAVSSGEGIIAAVRDDSTSRKGELQPGVSDKRLTIVLEEFALLLRIMSREGNVVGDVLRQAFDQRRLCIPTRHHSETAARSHLAIVAHITREELGELVRDVLLVNGMLNRYRYVYSDRAPIQTETRTPDPAALDRLAAVVRERLEPYTWHKRDDVAVFDFTSAGRTRWRELDPYYKRPRESNLEERLSGRTPTLAKRIALLYALCDGAKAIDLAHVEAAHAIVEHSEATALYAFHGRSAANSFAERIADILREAEGELVPRAQLWRAFHNASSDQLDVAIGELAAKGRVECLEILEPGAAAARAGPIGGCDETQRRVCGVRGVRGVRNPP